MSKNKSKKKTTLIIVLSIILAIIIALGIVAYLVYQDYKTAMAQVPVIKNAAEELIVGIKDDNPNLAKLAYKDVCESLDILEGILNKKMWQMATKVPTYGQYLITASDGLALGKDALANLLEPALDLIADNPLSGLSTDEGYNVGMVTNYINFLESKLSYCEEMIANLRDLDISFIDDEDKKGEYLDKAEELLQIYYENEEYVDLLKIILGDGEDKQYFLVCQNTAEIKAGGGYYGAMTLMTIKDGIFNIGDFGTWYDYLPDSPPYSYCNVTTQEYQLWGYNMYSPRDYCYCADFARSASLLYGALDYESGTIVDGVFGMAPTIIQRLLSACNAEITLDNGVILNGENTTKYIQRDVYMQYQGRNCDAAANNSYVDSLFVTVAKETISTVFDSLGLDTLVALLDEVKAAGENREISFWFADEDEQQFVCDLGFSGRLNYDPEYPEVGVYFNCCDANKMGPFLEKYVEITDSWDNADGSKSYSVEIVLKNNITDEEIYEAGNWWILGGWNNGIRGYGTFFAPAGGTVDSIYCSEISSFYHTNYLGLDVYGTKDILIYPGESYTFYMTVTTSADAKEELGINTNPTLQEYMLDD